MTSVSLTALKALQVLRDGLQTIEQGQIPEPPGFPLEATSRTLPDSEAAAYKYYWLVQLIGPVIGTGEDLSLFLAVLQQEQAPNLNPRHLAYCLGQSLLAHYGGTTAAWPQIWAEHHTAIQAFLAALEQQSLAFRLAARTQKALETQILQTWPGSFPVTLGFTHGIQVEVSHPLPDLDLPARVDRLVCQVLLEGTPLGVLELAVCDGRLRADVIADAIAAQFAWTILGRFFAHTVYPPTADLQTWHNDRGWELLLQQLWNRPDWTNAQFYQSDLVESSSPKLSVAQAHLVLEVSQELPQLVVSGAIAELWILPTVAGVALGWLSVPVVRGQVTPQALRVAILLASGFELCQAVVRAALVGQSLSDPTPLQARLATVAHQRQQAAFTTPDSLILGRRSGAPGTSAARWAMLPAAATPELVELATTTQEPILHQPPQGQAPGWAAYLPIHSPAPDRPPAPAPVPSAQPVPVRTHSRSEFETLFARGADPWKYTTPYEQTKYEQTLSLLPAGTLNRAMEIACAEGHFTVQLAPRVKQLTAADISQIALDRTAERCQAFQHLTYVQFDLVQDALPEPLDLIVCSEVLYFAGGRDTLRQIARKFTQALAPGGYLLMAHAHVVVDEPDQTGFNWNVPFGAKTISDVFSSMAELRLAREIWTPLYRIQLFQRHSRFSLPWTQSAPERIRLTEQPTALTPRVAARVLWQGGQPLTEAERPVTTEQLPILMYHRVAPTGAETMTRYRVTPARLEEQLQYLKDAGYYSVSLAAWRQAIANRQPLPGRAIALTFDDGYQDFYTHAAPLLKQYGFTATVFLVADQIGGANRWDQFYQEEIPLMGWPQIGQLQAEGFTFGSHSLTHQPLTGLTAADVVREAARSRTQLEQHLGVPVRTLAYPYGDSDPIVRQLVGACGYLFGLSSEPGWGTGRSDLLNLPRIEVSGTDTLETFVRNLTP